jgi:hypothetical protein
MSASSLLLLLPASIAKLDLPLLRSNVQTEWCQRFGHTTKHSCTPPRLLTKFMVPLM